MASHYRRLTPADLRVLTDSLTESDQPTEYNALASFHAVRVGRERASGAFVVHVAGPDQEGLPGKLLTNDFTQLKGEAKKAVHRSRVKRTVKDERDNDIEVEEFHPEGEVPDGAEVIETGINPHAFA